MFARLSDKTIRDFRQSGDKLSWLLAITLVYMYLRHDDITNKIGAPSEDSDQPGHPPSLIRIFAVRSVRN